MKALIPILELGEAVERSAAGIPRAWRLLKNGENAFTLKGEDATLTLGEKEFRAIVDYHRKKGCKIPIDSRHFVSHLATKLKRDESEAAAVGRYEEEALIHDWEYTFQPKTRLHFLIANLRFAVNAVIAAYVRSGAFSRRFWIDGGLGIALAGLCQLFGWTGYRQTKEKEFE